MTTAIRNALEQIQRLSPEELAELQTWINERQKAPTTPQAAAAITKPFPRRDFAADLRESWGDAPPMAENAVIALREEERF